MWCTKFENLTSFTLNLKLYYLKLLFFGYFLIFLFTDVESLSSEAIYNGDVPMDKCVNYHVFFQVGAKSCNGGLIGPKHVLTAASCVADLNGKIHSVPIKVTVGSYCMNSTQGESMVVKNAFIPADYKPAINQYCMTNLAVLELTAEVKSKDILELPPKGFQSYAGSPAMVSGFGVSDLTVQQYTHAIEIDRALDGLLRTAPVLVRSIETCMRDLEHPKIPDFSNFLCGRIPQFDSNQPRGMCHGDIGAPLVCGKVIIGILQFTTRDCIEEDSSSFYTRISCNLDFIEYVRKATDVTKLNETIAKGRAMPAPSNLLTGGVGGTAIY